MPDDAPSHTDSTTDHPPTSSAQVFAIAVKLSPFSTQEPVSWFRRAEVQFRLRKISDPCTQADYVLEAIPDNLFVRVSSWLDEQSGAIQYEDLKRYLLNEFTLTPSARAQRLLDFPKQPIGDRTANTVWQEMQSLARLPDLEPATGKNRRVDIMRELWLQTLPPSVRAALHDAHDLSMTELVQRADNLIIAANAAQRPSPIAIVEEETLVHALHGKRRPDKQNDARRPGARETSTPPGICYYHRRFRDRARNCANGCTWSKNV